MRSNGLARNRHLSLSAAAFIMAAVLLLLVPGEVRGQTNDQPTFANDSVTRTLPENSGAGVNVAGGTVTATDGDNDTLTYSLASTGDHGSFEIDSNGQIKTKTGGTHDFNFEGMKKSYTVTVQVSDGKADDGTSDMVADDDTITVTINLTNVNEAPDITTTETTKSIAENSTDVLTFAATDVDASTTLTWSVETSDDGSKFSISKNTDGDGELQFTTAPDFEMPAQSGSTDNEYVVTVKVTDDGSPAMSDTHKLTVTVTDANDAPTIDTGPAAISKPENTATSEVLGTYTASDVEMDTITWSLEGNDMGDFTITENSDGDGELKFASVPNFEMPAGSPGMEETDADNTYEITVKVTDDGSPVATATLDVVVTVTDVNEPPVITTTGTTHTAPSFAENTAVATAIATFEATDPDAGAVLTWTLTGNDAGDFDINSSGDGDGVLTFNASPDYETPGGSPEMMNGDPDNTYEVTVNVRDSKDADGMDDTAVDDMIDIVVTVTDANDAPTFDTTPANFDVAENTETTQVIATYMASDEDVPAQALSWMLEGEDAGDFTIEKNIDGAGELKFASVPDFEMPAGSPAMMNGYADNTYEITVKVTDDGSPVASATQDVVVTVTDVNEAPDITTDAAADKARSFPEIEFDVDTSTLTDAAYEVHDYDADDPDAGASLTWSVSGTDAASFDIDGDGKLSFKTTVTPDFEMPDDVFTSPETEGDNVYNIVVEVSDGLDDSGATEDPKVVDDMIDVTITVTNVDETPEITTTDAMTHTEPSFIEIKYDVADEDLAATARDVATYAARDEENEAVTWSVAGTDGDDFSIGETTGVLSFKNRPNYEVPTDRENTTESYLPNDNMYQIIVKATDGTTEPNDDPKTRELPVKVTVTNVDETPEITSKDATHTSPSFAEIEYDATSPVLTVATYTARDEENESITWTLGGTDMSDFTIGSSTGVLAFAQRPDFEMPDDAFMSPQTEGDNVYNIVVTATDGTTDPNTAANAKDLTVVVTVTDVNERPDIDEVSGNALSYSEVDHYFVITTENQPPTVHTFTATDYDDGDMFTWSLDGVDKDHLQIDASTGVLTFVQNDGAGPLPSFENPRDEDDGNDPNDPDVNAGDNKYHVTVIATDDDATPKATEYEVTITVTDAEEAGAIGVALPNDPPQVGDVVTFTLSDPDGGIDVSVGAIDWTIEARRPADDPDPAGPWVTVDDADPASLVKTYTVDEDDTGQELWATASYSDRRSSGKMAESTPTGAVVDERVLAPPRFRSGAGQTIDEGPAGRDAIATDTLSDVDMQVYTGITATDVDGEVLIWGLEGTHSDLFELIPSSETTIFSFQGYNITGYTAQLRAIQALDYGSLSPNPVVLTITLSDGKGIQGTEAVYDDTVDVMYEVTVAVINVAEITLSTQEVPEPGVTITASLADDDSDLTVASWQWQRSEDGETGWTDISGETSVTYTPHETDDVISGGDNDGEGYYLRVKVTYTDSEGVGRTATAIAGQMGTVNTPPQFPASETGQRSIDENSSRNSNIGVPVAATDPENNSLTYTLTGTDAESFSIVSSTGQLRVKEPLDYEVKSSYSVTIEVTDRRDSTGSSSEYIDDTQVVTITVENVDEDGEVTLSSPTRTGLRPACP